MKGLFPFLRELFFGDRSKFCSHDFCRARPLKECGSQQCAEHCRTWCECGAAIRYRQSIQAKRKDEHDWPDDLGVVG